MPHKRRCATVSLGSKATSEPYDGCWSCADEILIQVAAIKAALNTFSASLLSQELKACMEGDSEERLERVTKVLATLLKQS